MAAQELSPRQGCFRPPVPSPRFYPHCKSNTLTTPVPRIPLNVHDPMIVGNHPACLFAVEPGNKNLPACDQMNVFHAVTAGINLGIAGLEVLVHSNPPVLPISRPASLASVVLGRTLWRSEQGRPVCPGPGVITFVTFPPPSPARLATRRPVKTSTPRSEDSVQVAAASASSRPGRIFGIISTIVT